MKTECFNNEQSYILILLALCPADGPIAVPRDINE